MKIEDARKIIQEEGLQGYNLCEERENRENEVVLKKENEKWIVYVTDERASKIINSVDKYNTEAEAIEDFIERLRADKGKRQTMRQSLKSTPPIIGDVASCIRPEDYLTMA